MKRNKIGVVEDEVIIADNICALLREFNYDVCEPCSNYSEAIKMLNYEQPDLVLLDINLVRSLDGIEIANYIRNIKNIPLVFLTANSDKATIERAKTVKPEGYLVKPFTRQSLYATIEIALSNFNGNNNAYNIAANNASSSQSLFIKEGQHFYKVNLDDILYLSSDHVYVTVHTKTRNYLVRSSMQDYMDRLNNKKFVRVHRSYAINIDNIEELNNSYIVVNGQHIPVSKNHKESVLEVMQVC